MNPSDKNRPGPKGRPDPGDAGPVFDVTHFGASRDGATLATAGLQAAIDACGGAGAGTVLLPPGRYLSGALFLRSHVRLHLSPGATLVASQRPDDFPPMKGRDEGIERTIHASLLTGVDLEHVSLTGRGIIDGQGLPWWAADESTRLQRMEAKLPREAEHPPGAALRWPRPRVINLIRCRNVVCDGFTIKDGACWNVHLVYCQDVLIERLCSYQQRDARGTDAVIIDSSRRVRVSHCSFSSGSDCVGIKSGYNEDGRRVGLPSEDIVISDCHMYHTAASGVAIGSETSGDIRNVLVSGCTIQNAVSGIHVRSPRGRGGIVEHIRIANVIFDGIETMAIKVSHFFDSVRQEGRYGYKDHPGRSNVEVARARKAPVDAGTPTFRDLTFSGISVGKAREVAVIEGLPERYVRGLVFENITVTEARGGIFCSLAGEISVSNVRAESLETPVVDARDVEHLEVHRIQCARPTPDIPLLWLENVTGAFIHGCDVAPAGNAFSWLRQEHSQGVVLASNNVPPPPAAR
jgi:polygalacturonase